MMTRTELIRALRRMKAETGSLVCLGCGHEHNCSTQGCAIIRAAAEELELFSWHPTSTPPPDNRSVHICRGRTDFMSVCIGYYDHENKTWYEQRNWFATILPDPLFWMFIPDLPEERD
jgi:hypothetical protein